MKVTGATVAHIGVAVLNLDEAVKFYRDVLGATPQPPTTADGASIVSLTLGGVDIELLASGDPASPIAKFVATRGPGIHHICYRVPDLTRALAECRAHGYRLVDETPRAGAHGRRIAFLHPSSTAGILLELTE